MNSNNTNLLVRVRNNEVCNIDIEMFVQNIENNYGIDIKKLPSWKELIEKLKTSKLDCKTRLRQANNRKKKIIDKLFTEYTRPSPFELTFRLARTGGKFKSLKPKYIEEVLENLAPEVEEANVEELSLRDEAVQEEQTLTAHRNTEASELSKDTVKRGDSIPECSGLPLPQVIITNQHKFLSPLHTDDSYLSKKEPPLMNPSDSANLEWLKLSQCNTVKSVPAKIIIKRASKSEQVFLFYIRNEGLDYLHCRFKCVTDFTRFKSLTVQPEKPVRLYPGISVPYKVTFQLTDSEEDFCISLFFKVGKNIYSNSPVEAFCIPFEKETLKVPIVTVPELVCIPPAYPWHIKCNWRNPDQVVQISLEHEDKEYVLRITRSESDICSFVQSVSKESIRTISPSTTSVLNRVHETAQSTVKDSKHDEWPFAETDNVSLRTTDIINIFLQEAIERALDVLVFKNTYLNVKSRIKYKIPVYLTKAVGIGNYQFYYNFDFCDPQTDTPLLKKTIVFYGEILPHPVVIVPKLLDLSETPVIHGRCKDIIKMTNTNTVFPATVKLKLTKKTRRLININPMTATIPPKSHINFEVSSCFRERELSEFDEFVHFTIEIHITGNQILYENAPPFYYEIIAPVAEAYYRLST